MLTEAELRALILHEEGQHLDFKSLWDQSPPAPPRPRDRRKVRDDIAEYTAAFANTDGGTLILGVEDDHTPSGHAYTEADITEFLDTPNRRLDPVPTFRTQRIRLDNHELLVFEVDIAPRAVMVKANGFPYRVQDRLVREQQEVINRRKEAWTTLGYERIQPRGLDLSAVDLDYTRRYFTKTAFADRDPVDNLRRLRLVEDSAKGPQPTHAAILLFGKDPQRLHPRAGVRVFRVNGTERTHGRKRNVQQFPPIEGRLPDVLEKSKELLGTLVRKSEKLHDLFFKEMPEYPTEAWQEALVNAIAHRDYLQQGLAIEVTLFDDRMEIESPGDLVPPVTYEALNRGERLHASRNPLLCRTLTEAGIMREEGEGVLRMREELRECLLPPPEFEPRSGRVCITFRNSPTMLGGPPGWATFVRTLDLSDSQRRILSQRPEGFRNEDYREINGGDRDNAYREIHDLVQRGILAEPTGSGRGATYVLHPDLVRVLNLLADRLPRLKARIDEFGQVTNADYRQMFALSRKAALRDLQELAQIGFLRAKGERRGAHYLAGPRFEAI